MMGFRRWWQQPDQFDLFSSYLQSRGMCVAMRARIAVIAGSLSLIVLSSMRSPIGPKSFIQMCGAVVGTLIAVAGTLLWALRWPTRRQAITFAVAATTAIALASVAQDSAVAGLIGCTAFAALGIHIALFYAAPVALYNVFCAAVVGGIQAFRLSFEFGPVSALSAYWVVVLVNLAAPMGLRITGQVLGRDALLADRDPLTGLFNRRAFTMQAEQMLCESLAQDTVVVLTVLDLDRFKEVNDQRGHAAGDQALIAVGAALRDNTSDVAVIGRIGGEEFAVVERCPSAQVGARAQQLCDAVAALPFGVTASVGTASCDTHVQQLHPAARSLLTELLSGADAAMYVAKASGGNQARSLEVCKPAADDGSTSDGAESSDLTGRSRRQRR
jgi:diguanylate cyclase (GGDEF)-like protein